MFFIKIMGLKAFQFKTTIDTLHEIDVYLIFKSMTIDNDAQEVSVLFAGYSSREERERQISKENTGGKFIPYAMPIQGEKYLELFGMQTDKGILGYEISDAVWEQAKTTAFIPFFSLENGNLEMTLKSLNDLQAVEVIL